MSKMSKGDIARKKMMDYIIGYKEQNNGLSPTVREIGDACGMSSTSLVNHHLEELVRIGELKRIGSSRNLSVVGGRWTFGG